MAIGRAEEADVPAAHPSVSRRHAQLLFRADGSAYVRDLRSTHGTFLGRGRAQLPPGEIVPLRIGVPLRVGQSTRSYVLVGSQEAQVAEEDRAAAARLRSGAAKRPREGAPAAEMGASAVFDAIHADEPPPAQEEGRASLAAAGKRAASASAARAFDEADEMYDRTRPRSAAEMAAERILILAELNGLVDSGAEPARAAVPGEDALDSFMSDLSRSAAVDRRRELEGRLAELDRCLVDLKAVCGGSR